MRGLSEESAAPEVASTASSLKSRSVRSSHYWTRVEGSGHHWIRGNCCRATTSSAASDWTAALAEAARSGATSTSTVQGITSIWATAPH